MTYEARREGPVKALDSVSFEVNDNEFAVIVGPSGCGKSTILRLIAGLQTPTEGSVSVDGRVVVGPGADRGMVFQSYTLFPWLTVTKNVEFGLVLKGMPAEARKKISHQYVAEVGLSGFEKAYPKELSGGMMQRVAIARALANDPVVLLMDEPFGALDAQTRLEMGELTLRVWEHASKTVVFVTHDIEEALFLGDTLIVMTARPGRIREIISVPLPRPRTLDVLASPTFVSLKQRVIHLIRDEARKLRDDRDQEKPS